MTPEMASPVVDVHCGFGATPAAPRWGDAGEVRAALRSRGVGVAFLASDLARRFDPALGNEEAAEAAALYPELRAWLVAHPGRTADAHAQMRRFLYSDRFVGCALYPDPVTGQPVTARGAHDLLNAFRRFAKPLLIHAPTGEAVRHAAEIAQELAGMKVIVSGMGGAEWREAVDLAARPLNLYLDVSGALSPEKIEYALATLNGARKLLFASGAPDTDPAAVLGLLGDVALSEEDRARILGANALRLFALDGGEEAGERLQPLSPPAPEARSPAPEILRLDE